MPFKVSLLRTEGISRREFPSSGRTVFVSIVVDVGIVDIVDIVDIVGIIDIIVVVVAGIVVVVGIVDRVERLPQTNFGFSIFLLGCFIEICIGSTNA